MTRSLLCVALLLLTACGGEEAAREAAPAPPCMPAGLADSNVVEVLRLSSGCSWTTSAPLTSPAVITDSDALAAAIQCTEAGAPPSVDFAVDQVHVAEFSMSPAYGGMSIMDDGATITFVMRDRSPCPGDPMPMPMSASVAFRMPRGASRTYASASCTMQSACR